MNNTKDNYIKPAIEVMTIEAEGVIASSVDVNQTGYSGDANAKRRNSLWDDID